MLLNNRETVCIRHTTCYHPAPCQRKIYTFDFFTVTEHNGSAWRTNVAAILDSRNKRRRVGDNCIASRRHAVESVAALIVGNSAGSSRPLLSILVIQNHGNPGNGFFLRRHATGNRACTFLLLFLRDRLGSREDQMSGKHYSDADESRDGSHLIRPPCLRKNKSQKSASQLDHVQSYSKSKRAFRADSTSAISRAASIRPHCCRNKSLVLD